MTALDRAEGRRDAARLRSPLALGALAGGQALVAGLGLVLLPALVAWLAARGAASEQDGVWWGPLRAGAGAWVLGHGGSLQVPGAGAVVDVLPVGITALPVLFCWVTGRRALAAMDAGPRRPAPAELAAAAGGLVAAYAVGATAVAVLSTGPDLVVAVLRCALGALLLAALGAVPALLGGPEEREAVRARLPVRARGALERVAPLLVGTGRGVLVAAGVLAAAAVAVVLAALVLQRDQVVALTTALHPGLVGGAVLALAQLALVPVAAAWVLALLAGPGFAVGVGTSVTTGGVALGAVPGLPLLAALPQSVDLPASARLLLLVPVLAGAVGAAVVLRRRAAAPGGPASDGWGGAAARAGALALGTGLVVAVVVALASGSVGPGRMSVVGADAPLTGLLTGAEVLLGAAAVLAADRLRSRSPRG